MNIQIPYGNKHLPLELQSETSFEVLTSRIDKIEHPENGEELVLTAMRNPISSPRLKDLAAGKKAVTILISDHTRPVPSKQILPAMIEELRQGNPSIDITLLVATGCHRISSAEEIKEKVGEDIFSKEKIIVHDCDYPGANVCIGVLPSGAELIINRQAAEAELLVAEGFIEPHFFAGFSGGRKSVLPGICDRKTVLGNHCSSFISSEYAQTGILENNPIHLDMLAAVHLSGLAYIVNVIIDSKKETLAAFAGDPIQAHLEGCGFLQKHCEVTPIKKGDILITSNGGEPLDQNLYQAVKGMSAAETAAAPGAIIIVCAACKDGVGGEDFHKAMRDCKSPSSLLSEIEKTPMDQTIPDQWQNQILARILKKHRVILVSDPTLRNTIIEMKMDFAESLEKALEYAFSLKSKNSHVVVIPDGVSVIVKNSHN